MVKLKLKRNQGYSWTNLENIWVKGYGFLGDNPVESGALANLFAGKTKDEVLQTVKTLEGFFTVIVQYDEGILAVSDHMRSFPLFYYSVEEDVVLSDGLEETDIRDFKADENTRKQFEGVSYLLWDQTLFEGVKSIEARSYLWITNSGQVTAERYDVFQYQDKQIADLETSVQTLEAAYENTFKRLISYLNGRTAVIPLSGGHDSRLIAYYLVKLGYKNIIAFSYGDPKTQDSVISRKVAQTLNIPYYYFPYDRSSARRYYKKYHKDYLIYAGNGVSIPAFQTWCAVCWLKEKGIIDEQSVFCPGYGGVLPGHYLLPLFMEHEFVEKKQLVAAIEKEFFTPLSRIHPQYYGEFIKEVYAHKDIAALPEKIPAKQAAQLYEQWVYREDQVKAIQNATRMFELYGAKWATPFFEKAQFSAWSQIDNTLRYHNVAFKEMEKGIFEEPFSQIPFTGSKEKSKMAAKQTFLQKCIMTADKCLHPKKYHYMNVFVPLTTYWYNTIVKRNSSPSYFLQNEYFNLIEGCRQGKEKA